MPGRNARLLLFSCILALPACADDGDDGLGTSTSGGGTGSTDGSEGTDSTGDSASGTGGTGGTSDSTSSSAGTTSDSGGTDTSGGSTGGVDDGCPDENFPAVSPDPANGAYDDPYLNVYCTDDELIVESNGIPAYEFQQITPNALGSQDYEWHIPLQPTELGQPVEVALLGTIGIAVNGLPIFGPNEGPFPDPYGDPVYNGIMDFCLGHTAMQGVYHYHALLVECLVADAPANQRDPVIGYSLDGYPIYGPVGCADADCSGLTTYESGWEQTGDPTTYAWDNHAYVEKADPKYLDQCNGHVGPAGDYHYHATETFPYILGCHHGQPTNNQGP